MRCALLFSGEPRFFEPAFQRNQGTVWDQQEWDVFFHAWFPSGQVGDTYRSNFNHNPGGKIRADTAERLVELYRPKAYQIEPNREFPKKNFQVSGRSDHKLVNAIQSHFYSNRRLAEIKREYEEAQGFRYDLCLRMRFDNEVSTPIPLEGLDLEGNLWMAHFVRENEIGDQIYLGSSEVMDRFLRAYDYLDALYEHSLPRCGYFCSHHMLRSHCDLHGIPVKTLPHFTFGLLRGAENVDNVWGQSD